MDKHSHGKGGATPCGAGCQQSSRWTGGARSRRSIGRVRRIRRAYHWRVKEAGGRWVRYGHEAASALLTEISRAKGSEPLAPVTVVVASNQVGVSVRRQLASGALGPVCGAGPGL